MKVQWKYGLSIFFQKKMHSNPKETGDEYLFCTSKSMVEAGNISHDSSLIRFRSVHNIYKRRSKRNVSGNAEERESRMSS